ncbi:hypothetical protein BDA99DRAFT_516779 [Phascolomyces articulosus]|uniref:Uncharacterized protein n=1 Tax=Phascolomyces articulosus TaxID=60185 RepID=A0AAD5PC01_9FUNG|nr:hypothetical protein BDA99DRAFT_516779 [Phascolomyces articulosus]
MIVLVAVLHVRFALVVVFVAAAVVAVYVELLLLSKINVNVHVRTIIAVSFDAYNASKYTVKYIQKHSTRIGRRPRQVNTLYKQLIVLME